MIVLLSASALGQVPTALGVSSEGVPLASSSLTVSSGKTKTITFVVDQSTVAGNANIEFCVLARINKTALATPEAAFTLTLDGTGITSASLLNKGPTCQKKSGSTLTWGSSGTTATWMLAQSPDYTSAYTTNDSQNDYPLSQDAYYFEFKLGALTVGTHSLVIKNSASATIDMDNVQIANCVNVPVASSQAVTFLVPADAVQEQLPWVLSFSARINNPTVTAYAPVLSVALDAATSYLTGANLVNKGPTATCASGATFNWSQSVGSSGQSAFVLVNSPDYRADYSSSTAASSLEITSGPPYRYELSLGVLTPGVHTLYLQNLSAVGTAVLQNFALSTGVQIPADDSAVTEANLNIPAEGSSPLTFTASMGFTGRFNSPTLSAVTTALGMSVGGSNVASTALYNKASPFDTSSGNYPWVSSNKWAMFSSPDYLAAYFNADYLAENGAANQNTGLKITNTPEDPYVFDFDNIPVTAGTTCPVVFGNLISVASTSTTNEACLANVQLQSLVTIPVAGTLNLKYTVPGTVTGNSQISFSGRINYASLGGYTNCIEILLDGTQLTPSSLANKPSQFTTLNGTVSPWFQGNSVVLYYSPDFTSIYQGSAPTSYQIVASTGDPYHFVFDLGKLAAGSTHTLQIVSLQQSDAIVLQNLTVGPQIIQNVNGAEAVPPPLTAPAELIGTAPANWALNYTVSSAAGGALAINYGGTTTTVGSTFGLLNNVDDLTLANSATSPTGWTTTLVTGTQKQTLANSYPYTITATSSDGLYTLVRTVTPYYDHVSVSDALTNNSSVITGVEIQHNLESATDPTETIYLGGNQQYTIGTSTGAASGGENPTAFITQGATAGMGLVAEDDVFRVHSAALSSSGAVSLADDNLAIPAGSTYTQNWSVYLTGSEPTPREQYFEFVNRIRNFNAAHDIFALTGPIFFCGMGNGIFENWSTTSWSNFFQTTGTQTAVLSQLFADIDQAGVPPTDFDGDTTLECFGSEFLTESSVFTQPWINTIATAIGGVPHVGAGVNISPQVAVYFHSYLDTSSTGSPTGPANNTNQWTPSAVLDDTQTQPIYGGTTWGPNNWPRLYYGTTTNNYGQMLPQMLELVNSLGNSTQRCGVYWDEMNWSITNRTYDPTSTGSGWDGYSADLDDNNNPTKWSDTTLLTQQNNINLIGPNSSYAPVLCANSAPETTTMSALGTKFMRFVEVPNLSQLNLTHLYSPVGLDDNSTDAASMAENLRNYLDYGCLFTYYGVAPVAIPAAGVPYPAPVPGQTYIVSMLYPFTPYQLHNGYVMGNTKIVTKRSGTYGFGNTQAITAYLFDVNGWMVASPPAGTFSLGQDAVGNATVTASLPTYDTAIFVIGLPTAAGSATVTNTSGNSATITAPVNPNGTDTTINVEYGTTTSYGSVTSGQDAGSGTSGTGVNTALTGLQPNTTYYYSVIASNGSGKTTLFTGSFVTASINSGPTDTPVMPVWGLALLGSLLAWVAGRRLNYSHALS